MKWVGHVACMEEKETRNSYNILVWEPEGIWSEFSVIDEIFYNQTKILYCLQCYLNISIIMYFLLCT
jgi:hypothetical protein